MANTRLLRIFRKSLLRSSILVLATVLPVQTAYAETSPPPVAAASEGAAGAQSAPSSQIVKAVDIPYEEFTLANGLKVLVHEDHKAPVVAVSVWYGVGAKHEASGKTGFAHLFEHIMFNGSENAPGEYFANTRQMGATDVNGSTWLDRTNYYETVPKSALEAALFFESDRMGYLLGGVDQAKLDNQISVVSNEKRQNESQPFGLVGKRQEELLFPASHPYSHGTIGSLEDLRAASMADIHGWFRNNYGPNNAILVLAGDISVAEARPLVERQFGAIPAGPAIAQIAPIAVPSLAAPVTEVMYDKVPNARIYRSWLIPGLADPDFTNLAAGASVLGGLASSRLDNILVKQEKTALRVSTSITPFMLSSQFDVQVDVKPGEDVEAVSRRLDAIMAELIRRGPTRDEVRRVVNSSAAGTIRGLEQVGGDSGKATALAEGLLFAGDATYYKAELRRLAAVTPNSVKRAMQRWLTRPKLEIRVMPGDRPAYSEEPAPAAAATPAASAARAATRTMPEIGDTPGIDFPTVETAMLSNGIKVHFARRTAVPTVHVAISFDAGAAADPMARQGTHGMMVAMLDEGTRRMNSIQIAEASERLGLSLGVGGDFDTTTVSISALKANLRPSLDLMTEVLLQPAFDPAELERVRQQQLGAIAAEDTQPFAIALRNLPPMLYGAGHPYGAPFSGTGQAAVVADLSRDELIAFHRAWIHPSKATIFVVGDTSMAEIRPLLERKFGRWEGSAPAGVKATGAAIPEQTGKIIVINQPNSPQSLIVAGMVLPIEGRQDIFHLSAANDILGGDFTSRINMDLRESKGWAYGAGSFFSRPLGRMPFFAYAPVQADKTGPSITAIIDQIKAFETDHGVTPAELALLVRSNLLSQPGDFEQSGAVLRQIMNDAKLQRRFDYVETLAGRYRGLTAEQLDAAMRSAVDPSRLTWLVVGDVAKIRSQIDALGIPVQYIGADPAPAATGN